ncbi:MAG: BlaI/MecI/CopY family transcriptional regulator [Bacteroidota bacterium]
MRLPKAEEQVMKYLWKLEKAYLRDVKAQFPPPPPATTTLNTLLKRLRDKGYIDFETEGKNRIYFPLIKKNQYFARHINGLISNHFNNSVEQFASFFTKEVEASDEELQKLRDLIDEKLKNTSDD